MKLRTLIVAAAIAAMPFAANAGDAAAGKANEEISETKKLQLEFWTAVRSQLLQKKIVGNAQKARPGYWYDVALGRSNFVLSNTANTWEGRIGVRVYLGNAIAEQALEQLERQRDEIDIRQSFRKRVRRHLRKPLRFGR